MDTVYFSYTSRLAKIKRPISGEPMPIGTYNNGCIIGAVPLPLMGKGIKLFVLVKIAIMDILI